MDWLVVGIPLALITAAIIAWGLRAQRHDRGRRWPIIAVALLAGLVAGLAIVQAVWLAERWPHRRRLIDLTAVSVAAGLVLLATWSVFGPPFGIGREIEGGRIERGQSGYAITLPTDWRVEDVSDITELDGEPVPMGMRPELMAASEDMSERLFVAMFQLEEPISPAAMAYGLLADLESDPDVSGPSFVPVTLSVGQTFRVEFMREDGGSVVLYPLTEDGGSYCVLYFFAVEVPEDRFLPIAQTFEFMATGASAPPRERRVVSIHVQRSAPALTSRHLAWPRFRVVRLLTGLTENRDDALGRRGRRG